jgi:hypothetical protein
MPSCGGTTRTVGFGALAALELGGPDAMVAAEPTRPASTAAVAAHERNRRPLRCDRMSGLFGFVRSALNRFAALVAGCDTGNTSASALQGATSKWRVLQSERRS